MFVRLLIVVCMAVSGTIVGAANLPHMMPRAAGTPSPMTPIPVMSHVTDVAEPVDEATMEAGRARWHEILAGARKQSNAQPNFAGGVRKLSKRHAAKMPKRSSRAGFRSTVRGIARSLFAGPSIFEQTSHSKLRRGNPSRPIKPSLLSGPRRFGFYNRAAHGISRVIRRSTR